MGVDWMLIIAAYLERRPEEAIHKVDCDPLLKKPLRCAGLAFCCGQMPALDSGLSSYSKYNTLALQWLL